MSEMQRSVRQQRTLEGACGKLSTAVLSAREGKSMSNLFFSQGKVLNFERLSLTIEYSLMDFNLPLMEVRDPSATSEKVAVIVSSCTLRHCSRS